jgi:hypothetical protein
MNFTLAEMRAVCVAPFVAVGMLKMIVKMSMLPSVARCAGILMIRIDRVRVLIAIIGMQVWKVPNVKAIRYVWKVPNVKAIRYVHALTLIIE